MHDYVLAFIGGAMIGLSSSTMLGGLGRVTGISGILGSSLNIFQDDNQWRYSFLAGLIGGGAALYHFYPELFQYSVSASPVIIIVAGLLVGFGTRLGSGCTSGHGVCGLPRMAKRSFLATLTFMLFGVITVAIERFLS